MHCHCGTNNRAPRWTFTDPCKSEVRLGAREESASPAWLAAPATNARDTQNRYQKLRLHNDQLNTVSWINNSLPTGVVKTVLGSQTFHLPQQPCNQKDTQSSKLIVKMIRKKDWFNLFFILAVSALRSVSKHLKRTRPKKIIHHFKSDFTNNTIMSSWRCNFDIVDIAMWMMYTRYRVNIVYIVVLSCLHRRHRRHRDVNDVYTISCQHC